MPESGVICIPYAELTEGKRQLVNVKSEAVRLQAVRLGLGLDRLVRDSRAGIRREVALVGYGLDTLVHDRNASVRVAVASWGREKDLDILVHDKNIEVLHAVAASGKDRYIRLLANSTQPLHRKLAARYAKNERILDNLVQDEKEDVRAEVAARGIRKYLDILVWDDSVKVRTVVAGIGRLRYANVLQNDSSPRVRCAVARSGCCLMELMNDPDGTVASMAIRTAQRYQEEGLGKFSFEYAQKVIRRQKSGDSNAPPLRRPAKTDADGVPLIDVDYGFPGK